MDETLEAVLEAAFDLAEAQAGVDIGMPMETKRKRAYHALLEACEDYAAENDGKPTF